MTTLPPRRAYRGMAVGVQEGVSSELQALDMLEKLLRLVLLGRGTSIVDHPSTSHVTLLTD